MKVNLSDLLKGNLSEEQSTRLQQYFQEGGTWQSLLDLDNTQVEEIYQGGYDHYGAGEYDKALSAFSALIQINPYKDKHWLAMGAALHAKEEYKDALAAYEISLALNETSVHALFFSAQAAYALEDKELCEKFLDDLIEKAGSSKEEREFIKKAATIKGMLYK